MFVISCHREQGIFWKKLLKSFYQLLHPISSEVQKEDRFSGFNPLKCGIYNCWFNEFIRNLLLMHILYRFLKGFLFLSFSLDVEGHRFIGALPVLITVHGIISAN